MARTPRGALSRARRRVSSVRGERRTIRLPVNGPVANTIAWIQQIGTIGTHVGAPSDIMETSVVPSSGVEAQTGCFADGLETHQPMCMGFQPSRIDLDLQTLVELDETQCPESTDIDAANLQTVFPLEFQFGNQSSESIHASPFQSDGSLSCGARNPTSNALYAPPAASDYDFPAALCRSPEVISPPPDILPLQEAERLHLLNRLLVLERDQNLENASSLPPPEQLYLPNYLEWPLQMEYYDPPSHSHTSRSQLPLGEMIHGHSATSPQSFPFGHFLEQCSQQTLTDLDEDVHRQLLGSAPFCSSPSNERCAMEYPAGYPASPIPNVTTDIFPNIAEAARTIRPDDAILQFLEMANRIRRSENEIRRLEQNLMDSEQLVAALCDVNQHINDMDTVEAPITDCIQVPWASTAVYFHLIHFAAFQRN